MSDLQDELDRHEAAHWNNRLTKDSLIVEAARKYANPDYEAAAKARYEDVKRKAEQNGLIGFIDWDDLEDEERQEDWVDEIRPYVDAALGVTEDE